MLDVLPEKRTGWRVDARRSGRKGAGEARVDAKTGANADEDRQLTFSERLRALYEIGGAKEANSACLPIRPHAQLQEFGSILG